MNTITKDALDKLKQDSQFQKLHTILNRFNIFSTLNIEHFEIRHSNVLAWLFDTRGSHQLKDFPLSCFLNSLRQMNMPIAPTNSALVRREVKIGTSGQIDLLLDLNNGEILAIENKIKSGEGANQLKRYREALQKEYSYKTLHLLFLTPAGSSPKTDDEGKWIFGSYDLVADMVEAILKREDVQPDVRSFLEDYSEILKREVLMEDKEIEELCTDLYSHHSKVFDAVMEYKQDTQTQIKNFLEKSLQNEWNSEFELDRAFKNSITFYIKEFKNRPCLQINESVDYGGWKQPKNALTFEFKVQNGNLILKLMILAAKQDGFKEFLLHKIKANSLFNKGRQGNKWERILEETVLKQSEYDNVMEGIRDSIRAFMEKFIKGKYPKLKESLKEICQDYERENAQ